MANRLAKEQSTYLLQHAHNPVDWYPWGDEAFEAATKQNKPVLVSIGYAACHWCHVMERESFEDDTVAAYMNEHFINIKVDREEHPDVDHFYMDAVQAITHSGGWPLNVFVTPGRAPFYGGTYFPPKQAFNRISWMDLLQRMNEIWISKPNELQTQAEQMLRYLQQVSAGIEQQPAVAIGDETCGAIAANLLKQADKVNGGFGNAPKFPASMAISFLLSHTREKQDGQSLQHAMHSLNAMMSGGIYDQIGGGFARYATDDKWLVPHFEKMLYDNALLVMAYSEAYIVKGDVFYKKLIEDTIAFCNRELRHSSGIFYSALDADSEDVEGKYYTWVWKDWLDVVGEEGVISKAYFGVTENGNWEATNILHRAKSIQEIAAMHNAPATEIVREIQAVSEKLFIKRQNRIRPATDDKCLLSWNALMNLALVKAATALNNSNYLKQAISHIDTVLPAFEKDGKLMHIWKDGEARIAAHLDDNAYLIQALAQLASATGDEKYLLKAKAITEIVIENFSHEKSPMFYFSSAAQTHIPVRKIDVYDGATPSANAVMAHNLMLLGLCFEDSGYTARAEAMLRLMAGTVIKYPSSFGYWAMLLQYHLLGFRTVVVSGKNRKNILAQLRQAYYPHCLFITSGKEISDVPLLKGKNNSGETAIFVCTLQACLKPVNSVDSTLPLLVNS